MPNTQIHACNDVWPSPFHNVNMLDIVPFIQGHHLDGFVLFRVLCSPRCDRIRAALTWGTPDELRVASGGTHMRRPHCVLPFGPCLGHLGGFAKGMWTFPANAIRVRL